VVTASWDGLIKLWVSYAVWIIYCDHLIISVVGLIEVNGGPFFTDQRCAVADTIKARIFCVRVFLAPTTVLSTCK
jgi:hypothetical protein